MYVLISFFKIINFWQFDVSFLFPLLCSFFLFVPSARFEIYLFIHFLVKVIDTKLGGFDAGKVVFTAQIAETGKEETLFQVWTKGILRNQTLFILL